MFKGEAAHLPRYGFENAATDNFVRIVFRLKLPQRFRLSSVVRSSHPEPQQRSEAAFNKRPINAILVKKVFIF